MKILNQAEKVVYDGAARALRATVGMLFFSVETDTLEIRALRRCLIESLRSRASSSVVEQGTFNPRVEGSIPSWLMSPHRLEAQDTALSRRRHGFESRWGHLRGDPVRAISSGVEHLPYKEGVAGSNPASPTK